MRLGEADSLSAEDLERISRALEDAMKQVLRLTNQTGKFIVVKHCVHTGITNILDERWVFHVLI